MTAPPVNLAVDTDRGMLLLLSTDVGPLPWAHGDDAGEIVDAEETPIGKFWGGPREWTDRTELVVWLANNARTLLTLARQAQAAQEEIERLKESVRLFEEERRAWQETREGMNR